MFLLATSLLLIAASAGGSDRRFEPPGGRTGGSGGPVQPRRVDKKDLPVREVKDTALLSVQVYKTLSDAVIFDWFISLNDKDRMSTCDATYEATKPNSNATAEENANDANSALLLLSPFLPRQRTFLLYSLEPNQTYEFHMMCEDLGGRRYATKTITFTTDPLGSAPTSREFHRHQQQLDWRSREGDELVDEVLPVVNGKSLQPLEEGEAAIHHGETSSHRGGRMTTARSKRVSPHLVLGISCSVVGLLIVSITVGLVARRYRQYRASPSRLWELQATQELESMPSFINVAARTAAFGTALEAARGPTGQHQDDGGEEEEGLQMTTFFQSSPTACRELLCCQHTTLMVQDSGHKDSNANII